MYISDPSVENEPLRFKNKSKLSIIGTQTGNWVV